MISAIGNSGARSAGPSGCCVPGCSTGGSGFGKSAARLYQTFGMRDSSSMYLIESDIAHSPWCCAPAGGKSLRVEDLPSGVPDIYQVFTALLRQQKIAHDRDLVL